MPDLSDTLLSELQLQAAYELFNHDAYLNIAMFFDALNYGGIAKYFRAEAQSETKHAHSIMDYITKRGRVFRVKRVGDYGEGVIDPKIAGFGKAISDALDAAETGDDKKYGPHFFPLFQLAYELECFNTVRINGLARMAHDEDDHACYSFFEYYVREQATAEDETDEWMSKAKAYKSMPGLFWHLDREMHKAGAVGANPPDLNYADLYA